MGAYPSIGAAGALAKERGDRRRARSDGAESGCRSWRPSSARSSGGALALGVANRVLVLEFSCYLGHLAPEGCAAILWKDGSRADEAAARLKITAPDQLQLGIERYDRRGADRRRAPGP